MGRIIVFIFLIAAIPWAIATWWQMLRSQSARERAWVARASLGTWLFSVLAALAVVFLTARGMILALPVVAALGLGVRYGLVKMRARIRAEENDPLSRAKPLN